jgi:hypothetical protein
MKKPKYSIGDKVYVNSGSGGGVEQATIYGVFLNTTGWHQNNDINRKRKSGVYYIVGIGYQSPDPNWDWIKEEYLFPSKEKLIKSL